MAIKTILVKFTVDTDQLDKVESDYKGDYQNQLRSALGWAAESGISIEELYADPLKEFCDQEAVFRLQEFHGFSEGQAKRYAAEISKVINDVINDCEPLYDAIDREIDDYLEDLTMDDIIQRAFDCFEVILETPDGDYEFGLQGKDLLGCVAAAEAHHASGVYAHVYVDGCFDDGCSENIPLWSDGEWEDENNIKTAIVKSGQ